MGNEAVYTRKVRNTDGAGGPGRGEALETFSGSVARRVNGGEERGCEGKYWSNLKWPRERERERASERESQWAREQVQGSVIKVTLAG